MGATPTLTPLEAPTATCCAHCGRERWEGASTITTPAGTPTRTGSSTTQSSARAPAFAPSPWRCSCSRSPPASKRSSSPLRAGVALLADLIHNTGDAATAIPLGIAFALRSARAERWAGLRSSRRSSSAPASPATRPSTDWSPRRREAGAARGGWGARLRGQLGRGAIRTRAGRRLESAALVADGDHARRRLCLAGRRGKRWGVALGLPLPIRSSHSRSVGSSCESPAAPRRSTDE